MNHATPPKRPLSPQAIVVIIAAALIIAALVAAAIAGRFSPGSPGTPTPKGQQEVTLAGELVCLPHKNASGPQTLECALGFRADDGVYYALSDPHADYELISKQAVGTRIRVNGTFKPHETTIYQSAGTIVLSSVEEQ